MPAPTAVATRPPAPPPEGRKDRALVVTQAIESRAQALMEVMPDGLDAKRFMRSTLTAITRNPDLLACTPESIIVAVFEAAEIGLAPTGSLNRAWMVPQRVKVGNGYEKHAELRIGYEGLADLAKSGDASSIECRAVYQGDQFKVHYGSQPRIEHEPAFSPEDGPETMSHVYAVVRLKDGGQIFEVMTKAQVDAIRRRAPGANSGPWSTDYIQQARKTVLRRICHYLRLTPTAQVAIQREDEREIRPSEPKASRTNEVKALLDSRASGPQPPNSGPGDVIEGEADEVPAQGAADPQDEPLTDDELEEIADAAFGAQS